MIPLHCHFLSTTVVAFASDWDCLARMSWVRLIQDWPLAWFGICYLWFHGVLDWRQFTQFLMESTKPSLSVLLSLAVYCDSVGSIILPRMGSRHLKTLRIHWISTRQLLEAFLFPA